jgi:hypothetical protein
MRGRPYRGPAGAIDPHDVAPFDAVCARPAVYVETLAQVDEALTACITALGTLTPQDADLRRLAEVLTAGRDAIIRPRRPQPTQLRFP